MKSSDGSNVVFTDPVVPLWNRPQDGAGMVDEGFSGLTASVVDRVQGWVLVQTCYGYQGWIRESAVRSRGPERPWTPDYQVVHGFADILTQPKYQGLVLETLPAASQLMANGSEVDGWTEVITASGKAGWIRTDFLGPLPSRIRNQRSESETRVALTNTALGFRGTQYRWGGKTRTGIDCSGLCSLAYWLNGYPIYRDAIFQTGLLREISRNELLPGDLIYMTGHVAMYLGNDEVIHSTSPLSGVVINSLNPQATHFRSVLIDTLEHCATAF